MYNNVSEVIRTTSEPPYEIQIGSDVFVCSTVLTAIRKIIAAHQCVPYSREVFSPSAEEHTVDHNQLNETNEQRREPLQSTNRRNALRPIRTNVTSFNDEWIPQVPPHEIPNRFIADDRIIAELGIADLVANITDYSELRSLQSQRNSPYAIQQLRNVVKLIYAIVVRQRTYQTNYHALVDGLAVSINDTIRAWGMDSQLNTIYHHNMQIIDECNHIPHTTHWTDVVTDIGRTFVNTYDSLFWSIRDSILEHHGGDRTEISTSLSETLARIFLQHSLLRGLCKLTNMGSVAYMKANRQPSFNLDMCRGSPTNALLTLLTVLNFTKQTQESTTLHIRQNSQFVMIPSHDQDFETRIIRTLQLYTNRGSNLDFMRMFYEITEGLNYERQPITESNTR